MGFSLEKVCTPLASSLFDRRTTSLAGRGVAIFFFILIQEKMTCRSTWIFLAGAIGAATLFAMWSMPPSKPPVLLQKEGDDSETPQQTDAEAGEKEAAAVPQEAAEEQLPDVLYRRYHHWNSPNSGGLPADSLEKCESACSGDSSCFGVTWDGNMQTCAKLPNGNFDPKSGLLGEFTVDTVTTSMKDKSLTADHMDCFGPYKRGEVPNRLPPTYCPRSREAAVNSYFHNSRPISLFAGMFPGGSHGVNY